MAESPALPELREQLARWTATGLIEADQAQRIEAAERERLVVSPGRRLPLVAEVLGYVGAVIAIAAASVTIHQFWKNVPAPAELAFAAAVAIGLLAAGAATRAGSEPALARLRSVLWLLATASVTAFAAVLTHRYLHMPDHDVAVISAAAWTACAIPLWWQTRSALQHLAAFGGAIALTETGLDQLDPGIGNFGYGLALWVIAALWAAGAYRGYLPPRTAGVLLSAAGLLAGAIISMDDAAGQALAVLTVAGLLTAGIITRRVPVIIIGAIGVVYAVPDIANRYLPGSVGAPLAVAVTGIVLLGIALWLARTRRSA
jgi:predicted membrane protein DUF2157